MKKINWPKISLTSAERIWLEKVYEKIKQGIKPEYKTIRIELFNKLPSNFYPGHIDSKLVQNKGTEITLLGIYAIDPKSDLIDKINIVVTYMKNQLLSDPDLIGFKAEEVSKAVNIRADEIGLIIKLITMYGHFWRGAGGADFYGYGDISFNGDNNVFEQYVSFTCVEDLINNYYKEEEEKMNKIFDRIDYPVFKGNRIINFSEDSIHPFFRSRITHVDPRLCFVLMPFKEHWSKRIFEKYLRGNMEPFGFQCMKADSLSGHIIIEDIWAKINQAALIIADVTGKNPNVMYEVGIAHALGKPTILITQELSNFPFDFVHLRHHGYEDNADGLEKFSQLMTQIIPEIYKEYYPDLKLEKINGQN